MRIQLNDVRLAFGDLHTRGVYEGQDTGYGATLILKKGDPQIKKLESAFAAVQKAKWGDKKVRFVRDLPLRDGEEKDHLAGFDDSVMFIRANSRTAKPGVFDRDGVPLSSESGKPYSGCYVDAIIDVYAQENAYGKAINIGLAAIKFRRDGEAFAGGAPADADAFEEYEDDEGMGGGEESYLD